MSSYGWPVDRTQKITISAEEGQSRTATIVYQSTGDETLSDYVGKQVVYDFQSDAASGVLFTGTIDTAAYSPTENTITLQCSDNLQKSLDNMTDQEIEALIPGQFHRAMFSEKKTGWEYAQQLLKSAQGTLDLSPHGVARFTPWTVTESVDFSGGVFDKTLQASQGNTSSIINDLTIKVSHRYDLQRARRTRFLYERTQCEVIMGGINPDSFGSGSTRTLLYEMTYDAIDKMDAECIGFHAKMINSGSFSCNNSTILVNAAFWHRIWDTGCVLEKRWYQSVTETFDIRLKSLSSIAKYGDKTSELSCSLEHERDDDSWTDEQPVIDIEAIGPEPDSYTHPDVKKGLISGLENDYVSSIGWQQFLGDTMTMPISDDDYNDINAAVTVAVAIADATIKRSHRTGRVSFETIINPNVDIITRGSVSILGLGSASGKIGNIEYNIDFTPTGAKATQKTTLYLFDGLDGTTTAVADISIPEDDEYPADETYVSDINMAVGENLGWPIPDTFNGLGYEGAANDINAKMVWQIHLPAIAENLTDNVDFARPDANQDLLSGGQNDAMTIGVA